MRPGLGFLLSFLLAFGLGTARAELPSQVQLGLAWLQGQVAPDGSITGEAASIGTALQNRTEASRTIAALAAPATIPAVLSDSIATDSDAATESLARKILALKETGRSVVQLAGNLASRQNSDGGFGPAPGHASAALDTVWAINALVQAGQAYDAPAAWGYLLSRISTDGGIAADSVELRIQSSAVAILALQGASSDLVLLNAAKRIGQWLRLNQRLDGSWAGDTYLTALSLYAITALSGDAVAINNARNLLLARQSANGSWAEDPLLTAVALRAASREVPVEPPPTPASISGLILDAVTGTPLVGATVGLSGTAAGSLASGMDGRFTFGDLASGVYSLQVSKPGYAGASASVSLPPGQSADVGALRLTQLATTGTLRGRVTASATGLGIAGAAVTISGAANLNVLTDALGQYEIVNLPQGLVTITISAGGYALVSVAGNISAGQTLIFSPTLYVQDDPEIPNPEIPTTGRIVGQVLDLGSSAPLAGAGIELNAVPAGTTGASGAFDLTLAPGSYALRVSAAGYLDASGSFLLAAGSTVDFGTLLLYPQRTSTTVRGRVTDQATGQAVIGAEVGIAGGAVALSGPDGGYALVNLEGQFFDLRVAAAGYLTQSWQLQVEQPLEVAQDFVLMPQAASAIDLAISSVIPQNAEAQTTVSVTADVVNSAATAATAVLALQVLDAQGSVIAVGAGFDATGTNPLGPVSLAPGERLTAVLKWNTGQYPPGIYRLAVLASKVGTLTAAAPLGQVLATRETTVQVTPSLRFIGSVTADPPVIRSGLNSPLHLAALIQNAGNSELQSQVYRLQIIDEKTSGVVRSNDQFGTALAPNQMQTLSFPDWTPGAGGNYRLEVIAPGSPAQGKLVGRVYVGDSASASFSVNKTVVGAGNQSVRAKVLVSGQDVATGTISDPLAPLIKAAIQKAVTYGDLNASAWSVNNQCFGCHIQSQALVGGELTRSISTFNEKQRNEIYNGIATYLRPDGSIWVDSRYPNEQTALGLWALNAWHKKEEIVASLVKAADALVNTQEANGRWAFERTSPPAWWINYPAMTATNTKNLVDVHELLTRLPAGAATRLDQQAWLSSAALNGSVYLATDAADTVYVSNATAGTVLAVAPDGSLSTALSGMNSPRGITFGPDGALYVATASGVFRRASEGSPPELVTATPGYNLAFGPDGSMYLTSFDTDRVYRIGSTGAATTYLSGSPFIDPRAIAFAPNGDMILSVLGATDTGTGKILRVRPDKTFEVLVGLVHSAPLDFKPYAGGWLVATSAGLNFYNAQWQVERIGFGEPGQGPRGATVLADGTIILGSGVNLLWKIRRAPLDVAAKQAAYATAISKAANWLLIDGNFTSNNNIQQANRLIGLGNAAKFLAGTASANTLLAKMQQVNTLLRSRQRADGGWGLTSTAGISDTLVTAQVGFALDYLQPSPKDAAIQNAIQYLLTKQEASGAWRSSFMSQNALSLSATTWAEIWLPIALARIGGIDTDVTLRLPVNTTLSNPSVAPTATTSNADGGVTYKWSLTGVTSDGRAIDFDLNLADLHLGETRPAATEAFLAFNNSFTNETVSSPIPIPTITASAFLGFGVGVDASSFGANTSMTITAEVTNLGAGTASGAVAFDIYAQDGTLAATLTSAPFANLAPGATVNVSTDWYTGAFFAGFYYVEARLLDSANRLVASARSTFLIEPDSGAGTAMVSARLTTDKLAYLPTDSVRLLDRITNLTLNQSASGLVARTTILNPDGSLRSSLTATLGELVSGAVRDVEYVLPLAMAPAGTYQARLEVSDSSGATVAADSRIFTVESSAATGSGLLGSIQTTPAEVPQGELLLFDFEITNRGNSALSGLSLTVSIVDPAVQQVLASFPYAVNLDLGAQFSASGQWTSSGTPGRTYLAVLTAMVGGKSLTLALDDFRVIAPPVRFTLGAAPRHDPAALVLVSCRPGGDAAQPEDVSCATARAQWLAGYLASLGIAHRIVTTAEDFAAELHCGRYNLYWVSGGAEKLGATLAKEVREAVRRGHGLLIDGTHDQRNGLLDDIAGVNYRGKLPHSGYVVSLATPLFSGGTIVSAGTALQYELAGGTAQASFPDAAGQAAIVTREFGAGRAALFAFDLVASLQGPAPWPDAFRAALGYVTPVQPPRYHGKSLVPLALSIRNDGQAATLIVSAELHSGLTLEGVPQGATLDARGWPTWQFDLSAGASRDLAATVRAPGLSGQYGVTFHVSARRNGITTPYADVSASIAVEAADVIGPRTVAAILALTPSTAPQRNARDRAANATQLGIGLLVQGFGAEALSKFITAADDLATITTVAVAAAQADLARLIAEAEALECNVLPACNAAAPRMVSDGLFSPLLPQPQLQARGGGPAEWEWALGTDVDTAGNFVSADQDWESGKLYGWTLAYDGQGNATVSVRDGATTLFTRSFAASPGKELRTGIALQLGVTTLPEAGTARVEAALTRLMGQALAGALATRGDATYSESQLTYFLPAMLGGFSAEGTLRLSFPDALPPAGARLRFSVGSGNVDCRP